MKRCFKKCVFFTLLFWQVLGFSNTKMTAEIKSMHCQTCADKIERDLNKNKAIQVVKVDFNSRLLSVELKKNETLTKKELKDAVLRSGYHLIWKTIKVVEDKE